MVALFGYGLPGRVMSSPGRGDVPGWQGYVVALLVEGVPGQGGARPAGVAMYPARAVCARLWRCVPDREVVSCLARGICRI